MSDDKGAAEGSPRAIAPRTPVPRPPGPDSAPKEISTEHFSLPEVDSGALSELPDFSGITQGLPQEGHSRVKHGPEPASGTDDAPSSSGVSAFTGKLKGWGSSAATAMKKAVAPPEQKSAEDETKPPASPDSGRAQEVQTTSAAPSASWDAEGVPAPAPATAVREEPKPRLGSLGTSPAEQPAPAPAGAEPRKVKLSVARIDPWSVMKLSFLLSVAVGIMMVVAAWVFWYALNDLGVFVSINELIQGIAPESDLDILEYVARDRVLSLATVLGVVNVVLLTALGTIFAFLYNIVASLVGGTHLTMTDD